LTASGGLATVIEHMFAEGGQTVTERQRAILEFLHEYIEQQGYPPTVREIGEAVGLRSPSTVHAHLAQLERAGLLRRDPTKPRALELTDRRREEPREEAEVRRLPLLGQIAAGGPLLAEQNVEDEIGVPEPLSDGADFLLRVRGDSMVNAGILDGDIAVVQRRQDARNGEIVVALAGDDESADEATVKRFFREDGRVRLQPENDALEPIYAPHVQILGRVIGVFRRL
jgi:repressor LexA